MADNEKPEDTPPGAESAGETGSDTPLGAESAGESAGESPPDAGESPVNSPENDPAPAGADPLPADSAGEVGSETPQTADSAGDSETESPPGAPGIAPAPGNSADSAGDAPANSPAEAPKARKPRTDAQKAKRKADDARRKAAIQEAQDARPEAEDDPDSERKAAIREELQAVADDMEEAEAHLDKCKTRTKELLAELYPAMKANDRHVDAVRGYVASQKAMRANRALAPARLKAMLEAAGKAPIDAAFSTQRARGFARPTRQAQGIPAGDAAGSQE